jgi:hypothetical protein
MSFSGIGIVRRLKGKGLGTIEVGSLTLDTIRRPVLPLDADRAAKGLELLEGNAELKDA